MPKRLGIKVVDIAGNTNRRGKLNTIDLLIKVACFVKKVYDIFNVKNVLI
jgi:hypothetical protein